MYLKNVKNYYRFRNWAFDYIYDTPLKHGYVSIPEAYPYTSFHEYVKRGWHEPGWGHT
jgi:hypothetical protein